jgi:hypothetical protein
MSFLDVKFSPEKILLHVMLNRYPRAAQGVMRDVISKDGPQNTGFGISKTFV